MRKHSAHTVYLDTLGGGHGFEVHHHPFNLLRANRRWQCKVCRRSKVVPPHGPCRLCRQRKVKCSLWPNMLRSWALPPIFRYFLPFYSVLSVTCSPLVPSRAARTATKSPDKSPDGPPDHSAVRYHMPSFRSPQHSAASPFNPLWIASSLPHHDGPPAHDGAILRTASS